MSKTPFENKISSIKKLQELGEEWQKSNSRVCFTNGCFDILHKGHVKYLSEAKALGDILIVGVNSDDSVKRLNKGPNRPINDENSRAYLIAALEFVDAVVIFSEDTPENLINEIIPDVLVKGGDYDPGEEDRNHPKYIVGRGVVLKNGGSVKTIDFVEGFSTTETLKKL